MVINLEAWYFVIFHLGSFEDFMFFCNLKISAQNVFSKISQSESLVTKKFNSILYQIGN
jgi:hypothetical protein